MHAALDLLAAHELKKKFRAEELSHLLNLSVSRVRHLFQEQLQLSPAQVLKLRRLHNAHKLLVSTFKRVKEVMAEAGLNDASHFARDFKQMYGLTPSQLQKQRPASKARTASSHGSKRPSKAVGTSSKGEAKKLA